MKRGYLGKRYTIYVVNHETESRHDLSADEMQAILWRFCMAKTEAERGLTISCPRCNGTMGVIQRLDGSFFVCGCGEEVKIVRESTEE